jgi:two-component sensor histidine kinase
VVEDQSVILLDLKHALEQAGARVVEGGHYAEDADLAGAVLDGAAPIVADRLTERGLPFVFYSGRQADAFTRWPRVPVLGKPASSETIVGSLAGLLCAKDAGSRKSPSLTPHDLVATDALRHRPTKSNSRVAQVRAFCELSELIIRRPEYAVQRFLDLVVELCNAGSAGWSRLEHHAAGKEMFRWEALAGQLSPFVDETAHRDFSPCGLCMDAGKTILVSRPARLFTYLDKLDVPIVEALVVPIHDVGGALGALWVAHHNDKKFDADDARVVEELSVQLVLALKVLAEAKAHHREIAAKLALIQDTDHRVKNTIQSISSLLNLQAHSAKVPEARAAIEQASTRLGIFATLHELLHGKVDDSRAVNAADLIEKLVDALRAVRSNHDKRISIQVHSDQILLEPRIALPMSLFVNEAITNAYKHAYPNDQEGEIFVRLATIPNGGIRIGIQDDGVGFDPNVPEGFGLTLMRSFASQLGGHLAIHSGEGTTVQLTVPEDATAEARTQASEESKVA